MLHVISGNKRNFRRLVPVLLALSVTACSAGNSMRGPSVIDLTPAGQNVVILPDQNAVQAGRCTALGEVTGPPPFILPFDAKYRMFNKTAALGGNAILITRHSIGTAKGIAHKCENPPKPAAG